MTLLRRNYLEGIIWSSVFSFFFKDICTKKRLLHQKILTITEEITVPPSTYSLGVVGLKVSYLIPT